MQCRQILRQPNHTSRGGLCKAERKCLRISQDNQGKEDGNSDRTKAMT